MSIKPLSGAVFYDFLALLHHAGMILRAGRFVTLVPPITTPDDLLDIYFGVLQGHPGEERDWQLFTDLFIGEAHLRTVVLQDGSEHVGDWTVDEFTAHARELYEPNGISQVESARRIETHGSTAHGWCQFDSRVGIDGSAAVSRGVQSVQMLRLGGRWWITGIVVYLS